MTRMDLYSLKVGSYWVMINLLIDYLSIHTNHTALITLVWATSQEVSFFYSRTYDVLNLILEVTAMTFV